MSEALRTYLQMGGYAPFIWPAYGVAAVILVAFAIDSWRRVHLASTALRRLEAEAASRPRPAKSRPADAASAGNKSPAQPVSARLTQDQSGTQPDPRGADQQAGS